MEVAYRKSLHKSYMCVRVQEEVAEEYELCMLEGRKIPYLLAMETVLADGEKEYLYDISGKQQLEDYLSGKKMGYRMLWEVLCSVRELCLVLQEYLLREGGICLEPEYIYVNLADGNLYFTYLPFQDQSFPEAFGRYMEQLLRKIDHQDRMATELGYHVHQMCMMENANMQGIFDSIQKKEGDIVLDSGPGQKAEIKEQEWEGACVESNEVPFQKKRIWENPFWGDAVLPKKMPWLNHFLAGLKEGAKGNDFQEISTRGKARKESGFLENHFRNVFRKDVQPTRESVKACGGGQCREAGSKGGYGKTFEEGQGTADGSKCAYGKAHGENQNKKSFGQRSAAKEGGESQSSGIYQKGHYFTRKPLKKGMLHGKWEGIDTIGAEENKKEESHRKWGNRNENGIRGGMEAQEYQKNCNRYEDCFADGQEPAHPTEILGTRMQEPDGKLVYQGIHGCADILVSGDVFLLGKNRQQAMGVIEAEGISRLHAKISRQEGEYYLEDLNSTNGTYLNGNPVEYHQKKKLHKGDKIRFGAEEFLFS